MSTVGNTPLALTVIRVEARKSFSLGIHLTDRNGKYVDLTGCSLTFIAKPDQNVDDTDATNILDPDQFANISVPAAGYGSFEIQASTLDVAPREYPMAIVLTTGDGYSSVIAKGVLEVVQNTEWASVANSFDGVNPSQSLTVALQQQNAIHVFVGAQLPPGMSYIRYDQLTAIENFDPDSVAYVPAGGPNGYILTKVGPGDYQMAWRPSGNGEFELDATDVPLNNVPVAQGDDTWTWGVVGIDATGIEAGWAPVANGDDTWSWQRAISPKPDWNASPGDDEEILNKPSLGSIAEDAKEDYYASDTLVSEMEGVHFVTTPPVSGTVGHIYLVYTP